MSARAEWERWQLEGRPTLGSRMPLVDFLVERARWHAAIALADGVRGRPVNERDVAEVHSVVADLLSVARDRGVAL